MGVLFSLNGGRQRKPKGKRNRQNKVIASLIDRAANLRLGCFWGKRVNRLCYNNVAQSYSQPRNGKGIPGWLLIYPDVISLHCFALGQFAVTQTDIRP
jgi:hypothetical protein